MDHEPPPSRIYRNSPITEAIAEFYFDPGHAWNDDVEKEIHSALKSDYPEEPASQLRASISTGDLTGGEDSVKVRHRERRTIFRNSNKLVMVARGVISVHSLRPYETWNIWLPRIAKALEAYAKSTNSATVSKVGLRYINQVEIRRDSFNLLEYFTVAQGLPPAFPAQLNSFFDRMEMSYEDGAQIVFTWATVKPENDGGNAFLLDLDLQWADPCSVGEAIERLQDLHSREREAFESLIQDKLREVFDEPAN